MKKEFVPVRHFHFARERLRHRQLGRSHESGIERSVLWRSGNKYLLAIGSRDTDEAAIDFRRVVLGDFVIDVVFAALIDIDEQHVADRACLFDQRLLQRLLKVTLQTEISGTSKQSKCSCQQNGIPKSHAKTNGPDNHASTSFSEITYPSPRIVRISFGSWASSTLARR